ncbi:MAG: hypothetical protein JO171_11785 [Paludibacterium sp.]|uniref:hypothetical protein n=1 Tax=Paludibacterium sp. TaxID=1917523 RepID=UPI0025EE6EB3|nr:hypothetical protein [Paludibacterium sp.]MBV8047830.1 hypothetical protein [Paludibacterium sp.]MBV8648704.1 hypothetical protein [Paludibacterium sp.]
MRYRFAAPAAALCLSLLALPAMAAPVNFLFASSGDLPQLADLLSRPDVDGAQVVYTWKNLEKGKGQYDFSAIEEDLAYTRKLNKKLFIQIQDRFFDPKARNVPDYLMAEPAYKGGIVPQVDNPGQGKLPAMGWVAQQWNPAVQRRYQALLKALAAKFDGRVYGVNLPETAIDIDQKRDATGFSCERYFQAEVQNMQVAKSAFQKSQVVQYVNFWPCEWENDHRYMSRLFAFAANNHIGLGGPDVVPYRKSQMKNAYPFFNRYKGKLPMVAMAIQEPTLTYTNPKTKKPFSKDEIVSFATDYLGANILFWTPETPWLKRK